MPNIKLSYLYRDYGNYKNHGEAVFANPNELSVEYVTTLIMPQLLDDTWFLVSNWHLPDLHFDKYDDKLDHAFHEWAGIEYTYDPPTESISIDDFLILVAGAKGWE